jgi:uncharacterized protein (TIGR02001 family)
MGSKPDLRLPEWGSRAVVAAAAWLSFAGIPGSSVLAQESAGKSGAAINLGARGWIAPYGRPEGTESQFGYEIRAGVVTDYIYRGTTLSAHRPAGGAAAEISYGPFYAGVAAASVNLPTEPTAEITFAGGVRKNIGDTNVDLRMTYFLYPGETLTAGTPGIDYWEAGLRADRKITESIGVAGGLAYSPNVSGTGAWGWYAAAGLGYEFPSRLLPKDISVSFTGGAGYSWFGNQSLELGGFPLPSYLNWQAGVTFTHKAFNLDVRYYDTNLSRENCFVLTGDPHAQLGGAINPVTNPEGLRSNWCGATVVAKVWVALN